MQQRSRQFWLGCAVWAYKEWTGTLFPAGASNRNFLRLYSRRLTAVEGNTTFYSVPSPAIVHRWAAETSPDFRFCLKLPRTVTHHGTLSAKASAAIDFAGRVAPLGDRLGPLFAQLPPSYDAQEVRDLTTFLSRWKKTKLPIAVEVRHLDWFTPHNHQSLCSLLRSLKVGLVLLDTRPIYDGADDPQQHSVNRKPKVPLYHDTTADFVIVRYISHPDLARNWDYLAAWVEQVRVWLSEGLTVYFFVHCPIEARSPEIARQFQMLLEKAGVEVPPLPWNELAAEDQAPEQLTLF